MAQSLDLPPKKSRPVGLDPKSGWTCRLRTLEDVVALMFVRLFGRGSRDDCMCLFNRAMLWVGLLCVEVSLF